MRVHGGFGGDRLLRFSFHVPTHRIQVMRKPGEFISAPSCRSGAKLAGRDHRVPCPPRCPHDPALLHPLLHPQGVRTLQPPSQHSRQAAGPLQGVIFFNSGSSSRMATSMSEAACARSQ